MSAERDSTDMLTLMKLPEFRRFIFRSIQTAGILAQTSAGTQGSDGRDLAFAEGRRSLGFDLIGWCEVALPAPLRRPADNLHTLLSVLNEEAQEPKGKKNGGRSDDRYDDGSD